MIKSIRLKNFRGISDGYFEFGPEWNELQGRNEVGKSTISDAISFGFYSVDRHGNKNPDHLIKDGEPATEVIITTGSAVFTRKKRLGAGARAWLEPNGVPAIEMSQTALTTLLANEHDVFASSYELGFFMKLPDARKLEVVNSVIQVDRESLLKKHVRHPEQIPWRLVKLKNPRVDADNVAKERRALQKQIIYQMGSLRELTATALQTTAVLSDQEIADTEAQVSQIRAKADLCSLYRNDLVSYDKALLRYDAATRDFKQWQANIQTLALKTEALGTEPRLDEAVLKKQTDALTQELAALRLKKEVPPAQPTFQTLPKDSCTACGQTIPEKLREHAEAEKTAALNHYNAEARRVADHNQQVDNQIAEAQSKYDALMLKAVEVRGKVQVHRNTLADLKDQRARLGNQTEPAQPAKPEAPGCFAEEAQITATLADLRAKVTAAKLFIEQRDNNRTRQEDLSQTLAKLQREVEPLEELESVLKRLPEIEIEQTKEQLGLEGVSVKLVEGVLDVRVNNTPYSSLSSGRKIKTDFLWCQKFQSLMKNPPGFYFCDDADLVDKFQGYLPKQAQVFFARVKPELESLEVVKF